MSLLFLYHNPPRFLPRKSRHNDLFIHMLQSLAGLPTLPIYRDSPDFGAVLYSFGAIARTRDHALLALAFQILNDLAFYVRGPPLNRSGLEWILVNGERTFSMVKAIKTDARNRLNNTTLSSLIACKVNIDSKCFELHPPAELLHLAKSATYKSLSKKS